MHENPSNARAVSYEIPKIHARLVCVAFGKNILPPFQNIRCFKFVK
jgi:hypothetical protein